MAQIVQVLEETNKDLTKELNAARSGVALDNFKLLTVDLDRDYDARSSDSQLLESNLVESADPPRGDVKVLELQNGSVIASTIVIAKDWSTVSSKLEASIKDDSGSLKSMGVVDDEVHRFLLPHTVNGSPKDVQRTDTHDDVHNGMVVGRGSIRR